MSVEKIKHETFENRIVRYIGNTPLEGNPVSNLLLVEGFNEETGQYHLRASKGRYGGYSVYFVSIQTFQRDYVLESDDVITQEIRKLINQGVKTQSEIADINFKINEFALLSGEESTLQLESETPLEVKEIIEQGINQNSNALEVARTIGKNVEDLKKEFLEKEKQIQKYKKAVENLQALQMLQTEMMLKFKSELQKIKKILTSVSLYLGDNEEIVQIQAGNWASIDEILHIRQLVLYADEECAVRLEDGGLDWRYLEDFDDWIVSDIKHLEQLAPEPKCIVAIKPRRKNYNYGTNSYSFESQLNEKNRETYFLIRHGTNVFRVTTEWGVKDKLFPTQAEMDNYFTKDVYNPNTETYDLVKVAPDDSDYEDCLKNFERANLNYRNALLILQGLIDRTGLFPDLQDRGINLLFAHAFQDCVKLIHDADESKLLVTGKETFKQYQDRVNKRLDVGHRVVISSLREANRADREERRYYPTWRHGEPDDKQLYILQKGREGYEWTIKFENKDRNTTKLSSLGLNPEDRFILAYDLVSSEDMLYFLNDRLSRSEYLDLIPFIKKVCRWRIEEEEKEKPFLLMLTGYLSGFMKGKERSEVLAEAKDLIQNWKFKNKHFRYIQQNESKALNQIMLEFKAREQTRNVSFDFEKYVTPETLLIFRKGDKFIRYTKFDKFGVYLNKDTYSLSKFGVGVESVKQITASHRPSDKFILYKSQDWDKWAVEKGLESKFIWNQSLLDKALKHIDSAVEYVQTKELPDMQNKRGWNSFKNQVIHAYPLTVKITRFNNEVSITFAILNTYRKSLMYNIELSLKAFEFSFSDKGLRYRWNTSAYSSDIKEEIKDEWFQGDDYSHTILKFNNAERYEQDKQTVKEWNDLLYQKKRFIAEQVDKMRTEFDKIVTEEARQVYLAKFQDARNWEHYKQKAKIPVADNETEINPLTRFLWYLFIDKERFQRSAVIGRTLNEFAQMWKDFKPHLDDKYWTSLGKYDEFPFRLCEKVGDFVIFPEDKEFKPKDIFN